MQAVRVIRQAGPKVFMVSVKSPIEPPPEIGRIKARGRSSTGILKVLKSGAKTEEMASIKPDCRSIELAESMAIKAGKMDTTVLRPFSTPEIKVV